LIERHTPCSVGSREVIHMNGKYASPAGRPEDEELETATDEDDEEFDEGEDEDADDEESEDDSEEEA
jgi:hypothetical protein